MTSPFNFNSIPADIAVDIASLLEVQEVCCLGSCSKLWFDLCSSNSLWLDLSRKRWPGLHLDWQPSAPCEGWKSFYISRHKSLAQSASRVINFVEQCTQDGSLEVGYYLKAINDLRSMELGFKDVQLFLLARKHSIMLNLIGLHYSLCFLGISPDELMDTLRASQVDERQVCVSWCKLGRWFYGFRLPDEQRSRKISLRELAVSGEEVLAVLNRGAVHEVLRVQITTVKPVAVAESSQIMASAY